MTLNQTPCDICEVIYIRPLIACDRCQHPAPHFSSVDRVAIDIQLDHPALLLVTVSVHYCAACNHYFRAQPPFLRPDAIYTNRVVNKAVEAVYQDRMAMRCVPARLARDFWVAPCEGSVRQWCRIYQSTQALLEGKSTPEEMAELAKGRMREKRDQLAKALQGLVKPHHRFVLTELLCQIDSLDESILRFDEQIKEYCRPFEAVELLDTIPGVARETAEIIIAEIGTDMSRFPSADHLASWAGVAPGNNESAGKRRSGKTTKGNHALGVALNHAANAASHTKNTYLSAQYHRLAARRGKKKAIVALEHSILTIAYHIIQRKEPYHELGGDYFDKRRPEATAQRLIKRLEHLGFQVSLQPMPALAAV